MKLSCLGPRQKTKKRKSMITPSAYFCCSHDQNLLECHMFCWLLLAGPLHPDLQGYNWNSMAQVYEHGDVQLIQVNVPPSSLSLYNYDPLRYKKVERTRGEPKMNKKTGEKFYSVTQTVFESRADPPYVHGFGSSHSSLSSSSSTSLSSSSFSFRIFPQLPITSSSSSSPVTTSLKRQELIMASSSSSSTSSASEPLPMSSSNSTRASSSLPAFPPITAYHVLGEHACVIHGSSAVVHKCALCCEVEDPQYTHVETTLLKKINVYLCTDHGLWLTDQSRPKPTRPLQCFGGNDCPSGIPFPKHAEAEQSFGFGLFCKICKSGRSPLEHAPHDKKQGGGPSGGPSGGTSNGGTSGPSQQSSSSSSSSSNTSSTDRGAQGSQRPLQPDASVNKSEGSGSRTSRPLQQRSSSSLSISNLYEVFSEGHFIDIYI